jgi:hypothetical protein
MTLLDYFVEDNIAEGDTLFCSYTLESSMQVAFSEAMVARRSRNTIDAVVLSHQAKAWFCLLL